MVKRKSFAVTTAHALTSHSFEPFLWRHYVLIGLTTTTAITLNQPCDTTLQDQLGDQIIHVH